MGYTTTDAEEPSEQHNRLAEGADIPPGAWVERSSEGSITLVGTEEDGLSVHVDPDSDLVREMERKGVLEGNNVPAGFILEAIEEALDDDLASVAERIN